MVDYGVPQKCLTVGSTFQRLKKGIVDRKCRISDNDLLKSIAEISETAQQILREKQNSNSASILLRILEQTTLEDGTSDPGTLLSIADSIRKQEEGLCFVKLRQF